MARSKVRREPRRETHSQKGFTSSRKRNARSELGDLPKNARIMFDSETQLAEDRVRELNRRKDVPPISGMTANQTKYIRSIRSKGVTFGVGSAGVGKTFCAVSVGCELYIDGVVEKLIFCRPAVEAGEGHGFVPGTMEEKMAQWVMPIRNVLDYKLGKARVDYMVKNGVIEFQAFTNMRGLDWKGAFVMLDEAQNTTRVQMKMFLSRMGEGTTAVVDGDIEQIDLPDNLPSGMVEALSLFDLENDPDFKVVRFTVEDIVRSGICRRVIEAYAKRK